MSNNSQLPSENFNRAARIKTQRKNVTGSVTLDLENLLRLSHGAV